MRWRSAVLSLVLLAFFVGAWHWAVAPRAGAPTGGARFPTPGEVARHAWEELRHPFHDHGANDKGIGIQVAYSLGRVLLGYFLAFLVAQPLGFLLGMSPVLRDALNPFIQVLRPVSPLAWMPLALFTIKNSGVSAVFVIFICSLWPMLLNTAFGVAAVKRDFLNLARTHQLSKLRTAFTVILPAAAPTILTGMRISVGIAWLVIVAAEMLVGGTGIGYYVWNEWNNLNLASVIFSILVIGAVGFALDLLIGRAAEAVQYAG